jgi:RNA polymerase sigma factor (sigma-70 family)
LENASWVQRLALSLVRDPHLAEDLAQQTMVAALEGAPQKSARQRPWLARILRNHVYARHRAETRRQNREAQVAVEECDELPHDVVERAEVGKMLTEAVMRLEEPFRTTLLMRFHEDKTPKEIARELGIPAATVRTRLHRGLEKLRKEICRSWGEDWPSCSPALVAFASAGGSGVVKSSFWLMATALLFSFSAALFILQPWRTEAPFSMEAKALSAATEVLRPEQSLASPDFQADLDSLRTSLPMNSAGSAATPLGTVVLQGRCVARESGQPLTSCRIRFWTEPMQEAFTDKDGEFEFHLDNLSASIQYTIDLEHEGRLSRRGVWRPEVNPIESINFGDVPFDRGTIVEGRMLDEKDAPVAQAMIYFDSLIGQSLFNPLENVPVSAYSDEQGFFKFSSSLPPGARNLRFRAKGFMQVGPPFVNILGDVERQTIECRVKSMPYVEGRIQYPDGTPVVRAEIRAALKTGGWIASGRSDVDGKFRVYATREENDSFQLNVHGAGIQTFTTKSRFGWGDRDVKLVAEPTLYQNLKVVEGASGEAVQDFAVICQLKNESGRHLSSAERQNAGKHPEGALRVGALSNGTNLLIVVPADRRYRVSSPIEIKPSTSGGEPVVVEIERMQAFEVLIKDASGKPVVGSEVIILDALEKHKISRVIDLRKDLFHQSIFEDLEVLSRAETDERGIASVYFPPSLLTGAVLINGKHQQWKSALPNPLSQQGPIEITVKGLCQISGKFLYPPSMVGLAGLYFERIDTTIDTFSPPEDMVKPAEDGTYSKTLDPGVYRVHFYAPSLRTGQGTSGLRITIGSGWREIGPALGEFQAKEGEILQLDFDARLYGQGSLGGSIFVDGVPQKEAPFSLYSISSKSHTLIGGFRTDEEGNFYIEKLMFGKYQLRYSGPDEAKKWEAGLFSSEQVEVRADQAASQEFRFHYHSLRLRILHPDTGKPFANTEWSVTNRGLKALTDADGWLTIAPTPTGEYYFAHRENDVLFRVGPLLADPDRTESKMEIVAKRILP